MLSIEQLCTPGSDAIFVGVDATAADAIAIFQAHPRLRLLPVLNACHQPVGAIFEADVRQILFNPYGHALLRNPSFGGTLTGRIRACPTADVEQDLGSLLSHYAQADGREGMIITRAGRFHGVIENRALVSAAGAYELDRIRHREGQLDRLRAVGASFEIDIGALAAQLSSMATNLGDTAASTADRGAATGMRANSAATAAVQTGEAMRTVAAHGIELVEALDHLHGEAMQAKRSAQQAVALVAAGSHRADALYHSARSIESITAVIDALAGKVNMLAINATIEAARAGEAGRGFGIVASEVRGLAAQTREAAVEIGHHVVDVRRAVDEVLASREGIETVIAGLERVSLSVETTVDAQRRMTHEVAAGADQAAAASLDIRANMDAIQQAALGAAQGAGQMEQAAQALADSSGHLMQRVVAFLDDVRAA